MQRLPRLSSIWFFFVLLLLGGLGWACTDAFEDAELGTWKPVVTFPVVDANLTLADFINEGEKENVNVVEDSTNFLTVVFTDSLASQPAQNVLILPNQTLQSSFDGFVEVPRNPPPGQTISGSRAAEEDFGFSGAAFFPSGSELKRIALKDGELAINLQTSIRHDFELTLTLNSLLDENQDPVSVPLQLDYQGRSPVSADTTIDLEGTTLDLEGSDGFNNFQYSFDWMITSEGNPIDPDEELEFRFDLLQPRYRQIEGWLADYQLEDLERDTIDIELYDSRLAGNVFIEDPKIFLDLQNNFGLPSRFWLDTAVANINFENPIPFLGPGIQDSLQPAKVAFPSLSEGFVRKPSTFVINRQNSNAFQAFNPAPRDIAYEGRVAIGGGSKSITHFIRDQARLRGEARAEIPLEGRVEQYSLLDTLEADLPQPEEDGNDLDSVQVHLRVENGFPLQAWMQIYFASGPDFDLVFDSVINERLLRPHFTEGGTVTDSNLVVREAPVYPEGHPQEFRVSEPSSVKKAFFVSRERYDTLQQNTTHLFVRARMQTVNGGQDNVKIFSDYFMNVNLGIVTQIRRDLN